MRLSSVDIVLTNPYRTLGLVSPITSKELAKRKSDLETFAEFGKIKDYKLDMKSSFPLTRTLDTISDAARYLETDSDKLLYALFWFYKLDAVDEMAFDCIAKDDLGQAFEIWQKQIEKSYSAKFSWRININVLRFFEMNIKGFDADTFNLIVQDFGYLITHQLDDIKDNILSSNSSINDNVIGKKVIDVLVDYTSSTPNTPFGDFNIGLLNSFHGYSDELTDYAESKIINPCFHYVESIIKNSNDLIDTEDESEIYYKNDLETIEKLIHTLDYYSSNYRIKNIVNSYAEAARRCSLFAYNIVDDDDLALELINWADSLPAYGSIKETISKDKQVLQDRLANSLLEVQIEPIIDYLKSDISSLDDAKNRINMFEHMLQKIPVESEHYVGISSACVKKLLNYVIDSFNQAMEMFSDDKDINSLKYKAKKCEDIIASLIYFTMDYDTQQFFNKTSRDISKEKNNIDSTAEKVSSNELTTTSESSGGFITGSLYSLSEHTGINLAFLRVVFVLGTWMTGFWAGIILYVVLAFIVPKKQ